MKKIEVSIIVPVYNKEKDLKKCLDSLINQSLENIEIIVIDDKSTDSSKEIIKAYQKKYPDKIKAIFNKKNYGIGRTRNVGIANATGKYLGFVDGDDFVKSDMYISYFSFAEKNKLDIVTGYYNKVGNEDKLFYNSYFEISSVTKNPEILLQLDYGPCNKIFLKTLIEKNKIKFEENLKYEDMPFVAKALKYAKKIGHIKKSYYCYRIHENSETTTMDKRVYDIFEIMKIVTNEYSNKIFESVIEALNILQITRYMLQQKYQVDKNLRDNFINDGYKYLKQYNNYWRKNTWYRREPFYKRIIKNNKFLLKIYCSLF